MSGIGLPPGLVILSDWLPADACRDLASMTACLLLPLRRRGIQNDRSKVLRYGWTYESAKDAVPKRLDAWPDWLEKLRLLLPHPPSIEGCAITLNEYAPGYRIGSHVDSLRVSEAIQSISLGSEAVLKFTRPDYEAVTVTLVPGTLCVLTGEARYKWFHEVLPVQGLRYSIVFREYQLTGEPSMIMTMGS